ncbi:MAG: hypothetical protein AABY84_03235 [Candidatus Firestonebacteria bacterium]
MNPIFTLPYSEYAVAMALRKHFKKKDQFSILIPLSRQQKGYDLLLYNNKSKKCVTLQIKSSRNYEHQKTYKGVDVSLKNHLWFNRFKIKKGSADYYIFFAPYLKNKVEGKKLNKDRKISKWYDKLILVFTESEMSKFVKKLKNKTNNKQSNYFSFAFDREEDVHLTRGRGNKNPVKADKYLFDNKIREIFRRLHK